MEDPGTRVSIVAVVTTLAVAAMFAVLLFLSPYGPGADDDSGPKVVRPTPTSTTSPAEPGTPGAPAPSLPNPLILVPMPTAPAAPAAP